MSESAERKPRYGLVAIDLDGTLLTPGGEVTPRAKAAIAALAAAGVVVCYATGRTWPESRSAVAAAGHADVGVFVGGGMVVDLARSEILHRTIMHPQLAADVCRFFESRGHVALALQDRARSDADYLVSDRPPLRVETEVWMRVSGARVRPVAGLGDHPHADTMRVSVVAPPAATADLMRQLTSEFGDRVTSHSVGVHAYDVDVMEVFDPAVDKWQGVRLAAAARGVDPARIAAIGDGTNDLPMIRGAALGVAMGNAKDVVKAAADRVIGRNGADGLAIFLEELATGA